MRDGDIDYHRAARLSVYHHYIRFIGYNSPVSDDRSIPVQRDMAVFENWIGRILVVWNLKFNKLVV